MDVSTIVVSVIGVFTTLGGSWASWFFTRKRYNKEVDSVAIKNMEESLEFYKQLSDDNRRRLEEVLERNNQLEKEVAELRQQVFNLMHENVRNTRKKLEKVEKENKKLKKQDKKSQSK